MYRQRTLALLLAVLAAPWAHAAEPAPPPEVVRIEKYNCTQLLAEDDDARSSALLFYYGYALGQRKVTAYEPPQMGKMLQRVLDICKRNPDMPVSVGFATALDG